MRAAVVILTLVLMTVGAVGALVAGDTLDQLFISDAEATWGEVDVEVTSGETGMFEESAARRLGTAVIADTGVVAPRMILRTIVESTTSQRAKAVMMGLGAEEQSWSHLRSVEGTDDVLLLAPNQVIVNERLAERLDLQVGSPLAFLIAVPEVLVDQSGTDVPLRVPPKAVDFRAVVSGVVADTGTADLGRTPNVLMRRDALQQAVGFKGFITHFHMSTDGDADDLIREISPLLRLDDLVAAPVTEDALEIAEDEGGQFRSILVTLAVLVVVAAAIAAAQMLIALAEDRSREIAVLRALGTPGRTIVSLVTIESVTYALVAVILGLFLALPVAELLAGRLSDHFAAISAGRGREQVALVPVIEPSTLLSGAFIVAAAAAFAGRVCRSATCGGGSRRVVARTALAIAGVGAELATSTPDRVTGKFGARHGPDRRRCIRCAPLHRADVDPRGLVATSPASYKRPGPARQTGCRPEPGVGDRGGGGSGRLLAGLRDGLRDPRSPRGSSPSARS